MAAQSRREFVAATAAFMSANAFKLEANPLGLPIGSQIYPLRAMLKDFPAFVKMMADIGVTRLELCSPNRLDTGEFKVLSNGKEVKKIMADHGLKSESCHFALDELRSSQPKCIEWAKEVGVTQMLTNSLGDGNGDEHPNIDQVKKAAEEYNRIAAVSAKAGIQQALHNEGFEVSMVGGRRTYDLLFDLLDPKLVKYQFQMSTINQGLVGAEYFQKYPGRFISMHVQDVDMRVPLRDGRRPQVAVGKGSIDWLKTFHAAKTGGIKNYFVEQNWELTQQSVAYLKALTV
jgi:sugar phosphate isomerase/epimerase